MTENRFRPLCIAPHPILPDESKPPHKTTLSAIQHCRYRRVDGQGFICTKPGMKEAQSYGDMCNVMRRKDIGPKRVNAAVNSLPDPNE